jgi:DNA-directed RNA polymerase specialized sigma24 family protein
MTLEQLNKLLVPSPEWLDVVIANKLRTVPDPLGEAREVIHEATQYVLSNAKRFSSSTKGQVFDYLKRVAIGMAIDRLRSGWIKHRVRQDRDSLVEQEEADYDSRRTDYPPSSWICPQEVSDLKIDMRKMMSRLTDFERLIADMKSWDYSFNDMARRLRAARINASKSSVHRFWDQRLRPKMRRLLPGYENDSLSYLLRKELESRA